MGGEKHSRAPAAHNDWGSPPRVRGKVIRRRLDVRRRRITPACAGKSLLRFFWRCFCRDHPRVCGEKDAGPERTGKPEGSPPRVRGKAGFRLIFANGFGITPACAGKSNMASVIRNCKQGSPPRVRGKELSFARPVARWGITPACAGKRLKRSHSIGHFSCILCLFHSVLHRASVSGGSRAGPCAPPCLPAQNAVPV